MENERRNPDGAVFVSGATGGLGRQVVERLVERGRSVVAHGRRAEAVEALVSGTSSDAAGQVTGFVADLSDLDSVREACERTPLPPLHGIVANAGISSPITDRVSAQGYDLTFAVNVLAHQLLFHRLSTRLLPRGRVVVVSSGVHHPHNTLARRLRVPLPRWLGTEVLARQQHAPEGQRIDSGAQRYSTSKLANVYQARGLQRRLDALGLDGEVFALDPGLMIDTDLARDAPAPARWLLRTLGRRVTPHVANMRLSTTTSACVASLLEDERWTGRGFAYIDGDAEEPLADEALRDDRVDELWATSTRLIGLRSDETRLALD